MDKVGNLFSVFFHNLVLKGILMYQLKYQNPFWKVVRINNIIFFPYILAINDFMYMIENV